MTGLARDESSARDQGARRYGLDPWACGLLQHGDALSRFAIARLNARMDAFLALVNCRTVGEAATCEWNFLQRAWEDYAELATKQFWAWTDIAETAVAAGTALALTRGGNPAWGIASGTSSRAQARPAETRETAARTARANSAATA